MANTKYTTIAKGQPVPGKVDGVDNYKSVVGGGPQGGTKGSKKKLPKTKKSKTNPGL